MKWIHYLLVIIQFAGILFFALTGRNYPHDIYIFILQAIAFVVGAWAIIAMKLHTVTILPSVKQGGQLCTSGPYRLIRHPMYTAVLLLLFALLLNDYSPIRLVVFVLVFVNLLVKMNVEEKILMAHYTDYEDYISVTKRIIPFVY